MEKIVKFYRVGDLMVMCVPMDKSVEDVDFTYYDYYIKKYAEHTDYFRYAFGASEEWSEEELQEHKEYLEDCWDDLEADAQVLEEALMAQDNEGGN